MLVGTLSLVQKGQTSGFSGCSHIVDTGQTSGSSASTVCCVHCVTASNESTGLTFLHQRQCPHHHIPVADLGGHTQHTPPPQSKIFLISCSFSENLTKSYVGAPQRVGAPPTGNPGSAPVYHYSTASTAYCIDWFDLFAPKTMSPPPYTTIPLRLLHIVSTAHCGHTFESPLCNSYTT